MSYNDSHLSPSKITKFPDFLLGITRYGIADGIHHLGLYFCAYGVYKMGRPQLRAR